MTQQDPTMSILQTLQTAVTELHNAVTRLSHIVEGHPQLSVPSIRDTLADHATRLEAIEEARKTEQTKRDTLLGFAKWLFGLNLASFLGLALLIINLLEKLQ